MTIAELTRQIAAARARGDGAEVARLRFQLPLSLRNELITATGRGYASPLPSLRPSGPRERPPGTACGSTPTRTPYVPPSSQTAGVTPPTLVRISWKVSRSLREVAAEWSASGLETAGFLFGKMKVDCFGTGTLAEILEFSRPCRDDKRGASSLHYSERHLEDAFSGRLSDFPLIGGWHTHPSGSVEASPADFDSWRGDANEVSWREGRAPGYIGVIIGAKSPSGHWTAANLQEQAYFMPPMRWDGASTEPGPLPIKVEG
jgi:hypothetical protein